MASEFFGYMASKFYFAHSDHSEQAIKHPKYSIPYDFSSVLRKYKSEISCNA